MPTQCYIVVPAKVTKIRKLNKIASMVTYCYYYCKKKEKDKQIVKASFPIQFIKIHENVITFRNFRSSQG